MKQGIYVNGKLDTRHRIARAYSGSFDNTTIEYNTFAPTASTFSGYMNDPSIYNGRTKSDFPFSTWIKPSPLSGFILYLLTAANDGSYYKPVLGITSTGEPLVVLSLLPLGAHPTANPDPVVLNQWTHLALSVSYENGLCLYVNSVFKARRTEYYAGNGYIKTLHVGANTQYSQTYCYDARISEMQFFGVMNELHVFNRELTQNNLCTLYMA
ncbi:unnamed protein product [Adineta ricciae]|nr:unnamed protein product [Adineta ricciae]